MELLIALMCFAILSTFILSSASSFKHRHEQQLILDELQTALRYSKIQAALRGSPLYLIPHEPSNNWSEGMKLILSDTKNVIYEWRWQHPRWNITWKGSHSSNKISLSNAAMNAMSNGQFIIFNPYTKKQVILVLNRIGRLKIKHLKEKTVRTMPLLKTCP